MLDIYKGDIIEWLPGLIEETECQIPETVPSKKESLLERILYIEQELIFVIELSINPCLEKKVLPYERTKTEILRGLADGFAFRRTVDPYGKYANPKKEHLEKHKAVRDKTWDIIGEIVYKEPDIYIPELRGPLIKQVVEYHKVYKRIVYKYIVRWWVGGMVKNALLPSFDNCGGPEKDRIIEITSSTQSDSCNDTKVPVKRGRPSILQKQNPEWSGINITEDIKNTFKIAIRLFYDKREARPLRAAYQEMTAKMYNVGNKMDRGTLVAVIPPSYTIPSFDQFRYWHQKLQDYDKSLRKRLGKKYDLTARAILGDSTDMAQGPGSLYMIDATIADVYLVSTLNPHRIIGRPILYWVKDVLTRMIVGLYVGLEGPSWTSAQMAIVNTTSDKVAYCAEFGVEITKEEWPVQNLCEKFVGDGGELLSINSDALIEKLGISVSNCSPYRGDMKAIVEREFGIANEKVIKWIPGAVHNREPGEKDHRLDAKINITQFTRLMIGHVLEHNLANRLKDYRLGWDMIKDEVEPIPIEIWNWAKVNRSGQLRAKTPDTIKLALMPTAEATVTKAGILFKGMYYSCDLAIREQWFIKARNKKSWRIEVSFDTRKPQIIYIVLKDKTVVPCNRMEFEDKRFKNATHEEIEDYFALQNVKDKLHETERLQSAARLIAQREAEVAEAVARQKAEPKPDESNAKRVRDIPENRKEEKKRLAEKEAFDLTNGRKRSESATVLPFAASASEANAESKVNTAAGAKKNLLDTLKNNKGKNNG
jgi:putative transposase